MSRAPTAHSCPACSSTTCPTGCCDAEGVCRDGRTDAACGATGQACTACASVAVGDHCAASGFCNAGPHCGPDNCGGCCTCGRAGVPASAPGIAPVASTVASAKIAGIERHDVPGPVPAARPRKRARRHTPGAAPAR